MNITVSELVKEAFRCYFYSNDSVAVWNNNTVVNKSFFICFSRRASVITTSPVVNECVPSRHHYRHFFLSLYQEMLYTRI
jgi:hypothetical protein